MLLELQLLDAVDASPIWNKTIDLHCSDYRFYHFKDCSILKKRPFLVSCGKRDPNKAFVPGLMDFILAKNEYGTRSLQVFQNDEIILKISNLSGNNVIKFFIINTSGKSAP
jgi:hypothetical protein